MPNEVLVDGARSVCEPLPVVFTFAYGEEDLPWEDAAPVIVGIQQPNDYMVLLPDMPPPELGIKKANPSGFAKNDLPNYYQGNLFA